MPVSDPNSGRAFIWLITCLLFICIVAGGGCLVAYMILPESETASWIPIVGVTLVCLPWAFWLFTFFYRIFSRCFGYRVRIGVANGGGGGNGNRGAADAHNVNNNNNDHDNADVEVAAQAKGLDRTLSVASHESEMALKNSMAS